MFFSIGVITMNDNGWKIDEHGKRYRETAPGHREYEMTITLSGGVEIPVSELDEYHRRQKEAEEKRRQAALEEMKNRPTPRSCPFMDGCNNTCRREKCRIFLDGRCSIAVIADATGAEIEEAPARDKKCPFSIYGHCESCALYSIGCAIVRIATATKNK